jgi:hypothetical protein
MDIRNTIASFSALVNRQGGGLYFNRNAIYPYGDVTYVTGVKQPPGYKPLKMAIYDNDTGDDLISLTLSINPRDMNIGQTHVTSVGMTRHGWIPSLWGPQQITITCGGITSAFIVNTIGLTNYSRKDSVGFINFITLVSIFKNNGYNFLKALTEQTYYKDTYSKIIDVIDPIYISYNDVDYVGSYNSFTIEDDPASPYRLSYNFEFVVSGFKGDKIDGHIKTKDYSTNGKIEINQQGKLIGFREVAKLSESELNLDFKEIGEEFDAFYEDIDDYARGTGAGDSTTYGSNRPQYTQHGTKYNYWDPNIADFIAAVESTASSVYNMPANDVGALFMGEASGDSTAMNKWGAAGHCQITNIALAEMHRLFSETKSLYPSIEYITQLSSQEQIEKVATYYLKSAKSNSGKSAWDYLHDPNKNYSREERQTILCAAWFQPKYIDECLNDPDFVFPDPNVPLRNGGIDTINKYKNTIYLPNLEKIEKNKPGNMTTKGQKSNI